MKNPFTTKGACFFKLFSHWVSCVSLHHLILLSRRYSRIRAKCGTLEADCPSADVYYRGTAVHRCFLLHRTHPGYLLPRSDATPRSDAASRKEACASPRSVAVPRRAHPAT